MNLSHGRFLFEGLEEGSVWIVSLVLLKGPEGFGDPALGFLERGFEFHPGLEVMEQGKQKATRCAMVRLEAVKMWGLEEGKVVPVEKEIQGVIRWRPFLIVEVSWKLSATDQNVLGPLLGNPLGGHLGIVQTGDFHAGYQGGICAPDCDEVRLTEAFDNRLQSFLFDNVLATRTAHGEVVDDGAVQGVKVVEHSVHGWCGPDDAHFGTGRGPGLKQMFELRGHGVRRDIEDVRHNAVSGNDVRGANWIPRPRKGLGGEKVGT